jgi:hypothetical protein
LAREVFSCTYARTNRVLASSGLPLIPLKLEWTEMALVRVPEPLRAVGVTLMCGPFFSVMPFPARGLHSLSHVRYTPHLAWHEGGAHAVGGADSMSVERAPPVGGADSMRVERAPPAGRPPEGPRPSHFAWMVRDAARYLPLLSGCAYHGSLWETKAVLPRNEGDDGRPILLRRDHGLPNLHCVIGAKLDNVYDLMDQLEPAGHSGRRSA